MHVIEHILMSEAAAAAAGAEAQKQSNSQLQALEAKAVAEATATADAAYVPSPSLLKATTAEPLLRQVDGPRLFRYEAKESIYVGRSVPVGAGKALKVPIQVTAPGSVVEYSVQVKSHDVGFGITAEREEGITVVKDLGRMDAASSPVTGKFLVGSVPCMIQLNFENDYSYFREKVVSYKMTVTPPTLETLQAGRRRRAKACLKAVQDDVATVESKLTKATQQETSLEQNVESLTKQLEEAKVALAASKEEQTQLQKQTELRKLQIEELTKRLELGWDDEKETSQ